MRDSEIQRRITPTSRRLSSETAQSISHLEPFQLRPACPCSNTRYWLIQCCKHPDSARKEACIQGKPGVFKEGESCVRLPTAVRFAPRILLARPAVVRWGVRWRWRGCAGPVLVRVVLVVVLVLLWEGDGDAATREHLLFSLGDDDLQYCWRG